MNDGVAGPAAASHQAAVAIGRIVQKQAFVMAFSDTFFLLGADRRACRIAFAEEARPSRCGRLS